MIEILFWDRNLYILKYAKLDIICYKDIFDRDFFGKVLMKVNLSLLMYLCKLNQISVCCVYTEIRYTVPIFCRVSTLTILNHQKV